MTYTFSFMDLSLHSFILVVGLVVMAFILWDGIKKVKQSRANRLRIKLDDQFDQIAGDDTQFGSEFPNGGARSAQPMAGLDDDLHADRYEELEFDETLVGSESLSATADSSETYVTAALLNDVEQELNQMDAVEAVSSHGAELSNEPQLPEPAVVEDESSLSESSTVALIEAQAPLLEEALVSDLVADDAKPAEPIVESVSDTKTDFKAALADIAEPPIEFQMTSDKASASTDKDKEPASSNVQGVKKDKSKKEASAKAEKLKAELAKISAAKKQLAAKQAYEEAKQQETVEPEETETGDKTSSVPMLMEPVALGDTIDLNPPQQKELTLPDQPEPAPEPVIVPETHESDLESFSALDGDEDIHSQFDPLLDDVPQDVTVKEQVGERLKDRPLPQEVLVINVLKDEGEPLKGTDLKNIFQVCDLRHGEMDIFHRFEQANAKGKIQFSVANGVEPGTFDPATIDDSTTTGISFFMSLPGPEHPMEAFDAMVEVAHVFARNFNAELHDESHSDLTPQTIEHCRHRIREFCRKQKMNTASV